MTPAPSRLLLPAQAIATAVTILIVVLAPPASGRILLVPLAGTDAGRVATRAIAGGALLLGTGPVAGSIVVVGDRAAIARAVDGGAILLLAAPSDGCGESSSA